MKITEFAKIIAAVEGKKQSLSIAQISEVLRAINEETGGLLYVLIRWL